MCGRATLRFKARLTNRAEPNGTYLETFDSDENVRQCCPLQVVMLYAFGSNGSGQLGIIGKSDTAVPRECLFKTESRIIGRPKQIAAGGNHTLVLLESGDLYIAGSDDNTQSITEEAVEVFRRVSVSSSDAVIKLCSASWEASMIVTINDEIYTFGSGSKGELGTGNIFCPQPQQLLNFLPEQTIVVDVASGVHHMVVVLSNGEVYGWGNGRKGQIGQPAEVVLKPRKIENLDIRIVKAVCGREFTFLAADPKDGRYILLGADKWNLLSSAPSDIMEWKKVGASWGSIFVLKSSGIVESWGRNDRGQLALKSLPELENFAVGSEHVVALTKSNQLLTWGWGEHGNCGLDTDEIGDVKGKWSEIKPALQGRITPIQGIGAGCATSFFWT